MSSPSLLTALRARMRERGVDALYVPTADPHQSEYVHAHYSTRAFLTGFTGSLGTAIVTQDDALLWTDGRYFIQAAQQMADHGFALMKLRTPGFPTPAAWLFDHVPQNGVVAFNGRLLSQSLYTALADTLAPRAIRLISDETLLEDLWTDRPSLSTNKVFLHALAFTGQTTREKIDTLRQDQSDVDVVMLSALDNVAWLFNIRGSDMPHDPVAFAYALITPDSATLYLAPEAYDETLASDMADNGVSLRPYDAIWDDAPHVKGRVAIDPRTVSHALYEAFAEATRVDRDEPVFAQKGVLNDVERRCLKRAWLKDSVAVARFLAWLDAHVQEGEWTEHNVDDVLLGYRQDEADFLCPSFSTIAAYGDNAPMMHYSATPDTAKTLEPHGLFLLDSGGQYLDGTTDVTRTVALGTPTPDEIRDYTLVLKSHINLASARFLYGVKGSSLDILAREPLWRHHLDYKCGTGHGVGYVLGVHEGPLSFSRRPNEPTIEPGMVVTIEPGIYREGVRGIRLENTYLVVEDTTVGSDRFLRFEPLTWVPFDHRLIDMSALDAHERDWLETYDQNVYDHLKGRVDVATLSWLTRHTGADDGTPDA